jgi:NAD/NADP transhydrogenase beta subunit
MSESPYQKGFVEAPGMGWIKKISYLLDEQFVLPGTNFRFGIDPIINLLPIVGDMSSFMVSAVLVLSMANKGASNKLVVRMCINILLDAIFGAIPFIGQIFDFAFKANTRNVKLMKEHYLEGKHQGSGKNTIILALVILLIIMALLVFALLTLGGWVLSWFQS